MRKGRRWRGDRKQIPLSGIKAIHQKTQRDQIILL